MTLDWDATKASANEAKHGVDFPEAAGVFLDPYRLDGDATRPEDGEERRKVIGQVDGVVLVVVYTLRGQVIRLISGRRANVKERGEYSALRSRSG